LLQEQEDKTERVIAYASRTLKDHEKNYGAYLLELAAAIFGIEAFDTYLIGRRFKLCTDHRPLEKLGTTHTKTLNRLQQLMLEFDFELEYRKGEDNPVSDFLSRNVVAALEQLGLTVEECQRKDDETARIMKFLESGELPDVNDKEKNQIRKMAESCFMEEGKLWYSTSNRLRDKVLLYLPKELRRETIRAAHDSRDGGHGGIDRTVTRIRLSYYWPGMTVDVGEYIKECVVCQATKGGPPQKAPLQSMPTPTGPGQRVHIDLFGPLRTTSAGNKFVMVMTDAFTKYTELATLTHKSADEVARAFFERWICRHTAPEVLISDQGKEFCNRVLEKICDLWSIDKKRTSPFHPQTNSSAESYNRTMIKYIRAMLEDNLTLEWEELLPALMLSYNCHVHRSTGESPFFLTFLHDPRLPQFDISKPRKLYSDDYVSEQYMICQRAHEVAQQKMDEAKALSEAYYNKKAQERTFQEGDEVLVHFPNVTKGQNQKFFTKWRKFRVVKMVGRVNVQVQEGEKRKPILVHTNRVKPLAQADEHQEWEEEEQEEWTVETPTRRRDEQAQPQAPAPTSTTPVQQEPQGAWSDPWFALGECLWGERTATRSRGPVPDIALPPRCLTRK